ncbi:hypothetical protein THAOC_02693, partial [Thalassiosira oceanica]
MENFVLNLFADQLSRIILDFHRTEINANFLSGKGSITNVKLNVELINDFLNKPPHGAVPQLEFTEILLTELRVEVTSYTNLKRAPIVLVIEEIYATAREPLEYHVDPKQQKSAGTASTTTTTEKASTDGKRQSAATPQQYGLLHRILDNLSIRIKRINLSFSPLGKFKTRRHGPWTPPTLNVCFDNVELISVTETGQAGTPEQVWAHNELRVQQPRFRREANEQRHRSYVIYKRFTMEMSVKLPTRREDGTESKVISTLLSNTNMEVHIAYVRRLKDAGVSGVDVDVLVEDIDINLDVVPHSDGDRKKKDSARCDLGAFVHMLVGLLHCYYKDRSFVDPLLPDGMWRPTADNEAGLFLRGVAAKSDCEFVPEEEDEILPDDFLPAVEVVDDESTESEFDDEGSDGGENDDVLNEAQEGNSTDGTTLPESSDNENFTVDNPATDTQPDGTDEKAEYKRKRKAVIVIASGAQKFERLSFSLTLPRIAMKLCLPSEDDDTQSLDEDDSFCLELLLEGMKAESIWPKSDGDIGGHIQGSLNYIHLIELVYHKGWGSALPGKDGPTPFNVVKLNPLLRVGTRLFGGRDIFTQPHHLKIFNGASSSKCQDPTHDNSWFDNRWMTGRWHEDLSNDMVEASKTGKFGFLDHLQPLPSLYSSKKGYSDPLSSELRNFTGHLGSIVVRLPNPRVRLSAFRMAEVVLGIKEITIIVSSELPSSFLGGTIQTESASPTYPNDPRDICCRDPEKTSDLVVVFRMQVSLADLQMKTLSAESHDLPQVQVDDSYADLITPTTLTMMLSLESALPEQGAATQSKSRIISVLLQQFESNMDIRSVNGALETFSYHAANIVDYLNLSKSSSDHKVTREKSTHVLDCSKSTTRVCVHVPQVTLRMWGDCQNTKARAASHILLCQVRVNQFEFGSELMNRNGDEGAVHKCAVGNVDVGLRGKGGHTSTLQEIVSLGVDESPYTHLATKACASCFEDNSQPLHPTACFLLRSERYSTAEMATSVEITKPLLINVDINAIEFSINAGVETLLSPCFDSSPSSAEISQCPLGSHMWECGYNLASMLTSSSPRQVESSCTSHDEVDANVPEPASAFFRFALYRVFAVVPQDPAGVSSDTAAIDAFGFLGDAQIVTGDVCTTCAPGVTQRNCGVGGQTWKTAVPASDQRGKFHALKSTHALVEIVGGDGVINMCSNSINWSTPEGIQRQSCLPPVDLNKTMELASVMMNLGVPLSSLYFKLYKLAPANVTKQTGVGITNLHDMIGLYHRRVWDAFNKLKADINELQMAVYTKENERIGAMALASSSACGWVRASEELSFSHRLFSSATFFKYFMTFDTGSGLLLLSSSPGCPPSFVVPIRQTSQLKNISMSSTNKSIVGRHICRQGFALVDATDGMGLFIVCPTDEEHTKWSGLLSSEIQRLQVKSPEIPVADRISLEASEVITSADAEVARQPGTPNGLNAEDPFEVLDQHQHEAPPDPFAIFETTPPRATDDPLPQTPVSTDGLDQVADPELPRGMNEVPLDDSTTALTALETGQVNSHEEEDFDPFQSAVNIPTFSPQPAQPKRDRLAMARASKLGSRFGSALKTGMQSVANEAPRNKVEISKRSLQVGQKMRTKINAARATIEQMSERPTVERSRETGVLASHTNEIVTISNRLDTMKNASSKISSFAVTSVRTIDDTVKQLKIDEKVNQLTTAVRNESQKRRSETSRQRIGIGSDVDKKPVRFNGRETFGSSQSSNLPLKVKAAVSVGETLKLDELAAFADNMFKIGGDWAVSVDFKLHDSLSGGEQGVRQTTEFIINLQNLDDTGENYSTTKSPSEILTIHSKISHVLSACPNVAQVIGEGGDGVSVYDKLSPLEQVRITGSRLSRLAEEGREQAETLARYRCALVHKYIVALLRSRLPIEAIPIVQEFLGINASLNTGHPASDVTEAVGDALLSLTKSIPSDDVGQTNEVDAPAAESLNEILMRAYEKAMVERDEALAALAASFVMRDSQVLQKQQPVASTRSSDGDMLELCKQLNKEIAARTQHETEINRLNERLDLERKMAEARITELREELRT